MIDVAQEIIILHAVPMMIEKSVTLIHQGVEYVTITHRDDTRNLV
jgi:hypothetical protein